MIAHLVRLLRRFGRGSTPYFGVLGTKLLALHVDMTSTTRRLWR